MQKLNVKRLALGCGILAGAYVMLIGWAAALGWGNDLVELISSFYIGYGPSFLGGIIGAISVTFPTT